MAAAVAPAVAVAGAALAHGVHLHLTVRSGAISGQAGGGCAGGIGMGKSARLT